MAETSEDKQEGLSGVAIVSTCLSVRSCSFEGPWKENCAPCMWRGSVSYLWPGSLAGHSGELVLNNLIQVGKLVNLQHSSVDKVVTSLP